MSFLIQQPELPQDKAPTETQKWGWTFEDFISENLWYLLGILFLLAVFYFARYRWNKRNSRKYKN